MISLQISHQARAVHAVKAFLISSALLFSVGVSAEPTPQNCSAVTKETCKIAHELGAGINMGNMLDAPKEGDWGVRLDSKYIDLAAQKFKTVRIPIRWSNHASLGKSAIIDKYFFNRVEHIVDQFLAKDMYVIINIHHYNQLNGAKLSNNELAVDDAIVQQRFLNMWQQISHRFKDKSSKLIFEVLNEPHKKLEGDRWYTLMNSAMNIIRKENPDRVIMIAPSGNRIPSFTQLKEVVSQPYDKNIIVAFHNYDPVQFTFQGFSWMPQFPKGVVCCSPAQKNIINNKLMTAVNWNKSFGIPVHLGEFGANNNGDLDSRVDYNKSVVSLLNQYSIGWTYWEFASSFGIYNPKKKQWRTPLLESLFVN